MAGVAACTYVVKHVYFHIITRVNDHYYHDFGHCDDILWVFRYYDNSDNIVQENQMENNQEMNIIF